MQGRKLGENTYVKWRETPVGTVFQGYVIRMETSVAFPNSPTVFIQTDAGAEVGLPTTARLVVALRSGNVIPGNYLRVTYKGSEKVTKGKFANGHSENRLFEVEVFDELDKSSDPRYAQQQQVFNNFYAARGGAPAQAYQQVQQQGLLDSAVALQTFLDRRVVRQQGLLAQRMKVWKCWVGKKVRLWRQNQSQNQ